VRVRVGLLHRLYCQRKGAPAVCTRAQHSNTAYPGIDSKRQTEEKKVEMNGNAHSSGAVRRSNRTTYNAAPRTQTENALTHSGARRGKESTKQTIAGAGPYTRKIVTSSESARSAVRLLLLSKVFDNAAYEWFLHRATVQ
jgi:hypothetical protein